MDEAINMEILLGLPMMTTCHTAHVRALLPMIRQYRYPAFSTISTSIAAARTHIVKGAIKQSFKYVMFIDDDMVFPPWGVNKLWEQDKDIIGGLYFSKYPPFTPHIREYADKKLIPIEDYPKEETFEVGAIATGFMLVRREVFKGIEEPWFDYHFNDMNTSDDFHFCMKAKDAGYKIFCDPTIELRHVGGPQGVTEETYEDYRRRHKNGK